MTREEFLTRFPNATPSTLRANGYPVAGLQDPKREPDQRREGQDHQLDKSTSGVGYRIAIISLRRRLADGHDNLRTGAKPLVDAITKTLGFASDDNPRLTWEYGQIVSGSEGTIVKIECVAETPCQPPPREV